MVKPSLQRSRSKRRDVTTPSKEPVLSEQIVEIPQENVELIKRSLGIDLETAPQQVRQAVVGVTGSISHSPYPSGEMFANYVEHGFPDVPAKIIQIIDEQRHHRLELERTRVAGSERRQYIGQIGALVVGVTGVVGALIANHFGGSAWLCSMVAVVCVGGPNAATVLVRVLDRTVSK